MLSRQPETPPRAWGRPITSSDRASNSGNTPTCVGKTVADGRMWFGVQKHPHVRGEDCDSTHGSAAYWETPPRAWGRLLEHVFFQYPGRNTPTCVGKTKSSPGSRWAGWKHPHVRGEDNVPPAATGEEQETPPRAWGRLSKGTAGILRSGNTPTCVGKTGQKKRKLHPLRKHPHVRGEDRVPAGPEYPCRETPPRAWGRPCGCANAADRRRNTPTCVGKTLFPP